MMYMAAYTPVPLAHVCTIATYAADYVLQYPDLFARDFAECFSLTICLRSAVFSFISANGDEIEAGCTNNDVCQHCGGGGGSVRLQYVCGKR